MRSHTLYCQGFVQITQSHTPQDLDVDVKLIIFFLVDQKRHLLTFAESVYHITQTPLPDISDAPHRSLDLFITRMSLILYAYVIKWIDLEQIRQDNMPTSQ